MRLLYCLLLLLIFSAVFLPPYLILQTSASAQSRQPYTEGAGPVERRLIFVEEEVRSNSNKIAKLQQDAAVGRYYDDALKLANLPVRMSLEESRMELIIKTFDVFMGIVGALVVGVTVQLVMARKNAQKLDTIHDQSNGQTARLILLTKEKAHAEGMLQGMAEAATQPKS